jgi:hypothetical protein
MSPQFERRGQVSLLIWGTGMGVSVVDWLGLGRATEYREPECDPGPIVRVFPLRVL